MEYDLVTEKFLRVLYQDGTSGTASLDETFRDAERISLISGSVHEQAALLMLLVAIAQRGIGPLADESDRKAKRDQIVLAARRYLKKHAGEFGLWDLKRPFYQIAAYTEPSKPDDRRIGNCSTSRLSFDRPTGNNHTLHNHDALLPDRPLAEDEIARNLVCFQSFAAGGLLKTKGAEKGGWGKKTPSAGASPLNNKFVVIATGSSLLDTIWLHLVTREQFRDDDRLGKPFWELDLSSVEDVEKYARSYYGCILPMPWAIHVHDARRMSLNEVVKYRDFKHPLLVERKSKNGKKYHLQMKDAADWFVWRELAAALEYQDGGRPWPLARLKSYVSVTKRRGMIVAGGFFANQAKLSCPLESVCCIENETADVDSGWMSNYCACLQWAEECSRRLHAAEKGFVGELRRRGIFAGRESRPSQMSRFQACPDFWWRLTGQQELLRKAACHLDDEKVRDEWWSRCWREMAQAYDSAFGSCLDSRTWMAYAVGKACLFGDGGIKKKPEDDKMNDSAADSEVEELVAALVAARHDSGTMAKLAMGANEDGERLTYPFIFRNSEAFSTDARLRTAVTLVAAFAAHRQHSAAAGNFGMSLAQLWKAEKSGRDGMTRQFEQLLDIERENLRYYVCQWVRRLSSREICINYGLLFRDLLYWNGQCKRQWAEAYCRGIGR